MPRSQFLQMMVNAEKLWSDLMDKNKTTGRQSKHDLIQSEGGEEEAVLDTSEYDE